MTDMAYWRAQIEAVLDILDYDAKLLERPAGDALIINAPTTEAKLDIANGLGRIDVLVAGVSGIGHTLEVDITQDRLDDPLVDVEEPVTDGGRAFRVDLSRFQIDLLAAVATLERPKGLAIKAELEARSDEVVHHGRLYPNLDELVDADLLEKGSQDERTNWYDLTPKGRAVLEDRAAWLAGSASDGAEVVLR